MGNLMCCFKPKHRPQKIGKIFTDLRTTRQTPQGRDVSVNFLPHISERELPDETDEDPSTHPTAQPTFMERSQIKSNRNSMYVLDELNDRRVGLKRWNSCSTIYLDDSTISQPHLKHTVMCLSLGMRYLNNFNRLLPHCKSKQSRSRKIDGESLKKDFIPFWLPESNPLEIHDPDHRTIYRFIRALFQAAQLTAECAIITLVYIERLLNYAEIDLCPSNWRRIVLGAIMLASKVWDDQAVWNVDYCQILHDTNVDDMNELERQFLECLEFNINVPGSVYAKYYYELRTLSKTNDLYMAQRPLSKERARKLEASSQHCLRRQTSHGKGQTKKKLVG
ncbi:Cyclin-Y-like protein 1 [Aphelenchoides bicaudatus]|nr:Cyclin-Y-like protein 1 [Aphelenchoides bicaudatus]